MVTVDPRDELGNRRLSELVERAQGDDGKFAELLVAEVFQVRHDNSTAWYDARHPSSGTKYEVKSTHVDVDDGATGRFRLWESQHRRIAGAEGADGQTAYYGFVLFDGDQPVALRRMHPSTVTRVLRERGGEDSAWNRSGHQEQGRQHKLPWTEVLER
jgi:hypothetical protein